MSKNIISFSLWGEMPIYIKGASENIRLAKEIYPGWTCRLHTHHPRQSDIVKKLIDEGAEVEIVDESPGWNGLFWRFFTADDQNVDRFIVRDCDSRLSMREKLAVDEWIASGTPFHCMRDHPAHNVPILGGMWGAVKGCLPNMGKMLNEWKIKKTPIPKGADQYFMTRTILPLVKDRMLIHDSFNKGCRDFPTPREGLAFVGEIYDENNVPKKADRDVMGKAILAGKIK